MSKITVPEKFLFHVRGWSVYQLFTGNSPLWERLKIIKTDDVGKPLCRPRRGEQRTFGASWGIDAQRFARSSDYVRFVVENPDINAALEKRCARCFTVEKLEAALGKQNVDKERRRLEERRQAWRAQRVEQDARKMEAAHAAALEEDALWRRLYE